MTKPRARYVSSNFSDSLVEERASVAALIRAAAMLAGATAGLHDAGREVTCRFDTEMSTVIEIPGWVAVGGPG